MSVTRSRRLIVILLAMLLMLPAASIGTAHIARAADQDPGSTSANLTAIQIASLSTFLSENGVPEGTRASLLQKLAAGEMWDSMSGDEPVSVTESTTAVDRRTVSTYEDGSVVVDTIQLPTPAPGHGTITAFDVKNCRSSASGSGYTNYYDCQAASSTGIMTMGFYISYTLVDGVGDKINAVSSPYRQATVGTSTPPTLSIAKKIENSSGSAWARIQSTWTGFAGAPSGTYEMRALVGGNAAWTRWESKGVEP
ncbi:hypothetical protein [Oerskovia sp. KBS0722]|uniref:hypothetical protein n=1 Tax=Oerskovia sp. KBS0722 TaxID=1179673 RepID=UPI00110E6800|nr:hypothetical protein [Oerskovia sp. KBS0722]QDW62315.1 hypothetical protein FFI11_007000 [Oerskovia sp. KBS0722]